MNLLTSHGFFCESDPKEDPTRTKNGYKRWRLLCGYWITLGPQQKSTKQNASDLSWKVPHCMAIQRFETTRMLRSLTVFDCISKHRIWCATFFPAGIEHAANQGKISAQPHTIVKQICFPNGNLLFLSLFPLSKNWMHSMGLCGNFTQIKPGVWISSSTAY